jgi:hypothetical protein
MIINEKFYGSKQNSIELNQNLNFKSYSENDIILNKSKYSIGSFLSVSLTLPRRISV